ncbi:MAG TPA: hypothetical protein VJT75_10110 [Thermoleophilaceae bacterium]|nr:hypothetical protein [Thermoleophilaceae bacterium]
MSEPAAVSLAFFDAERGLHGSLRTGVGVLFEGQRAATVDDAPAIEPAGGGWRVSSGEVLDLEFEPCSPAADLGGSSARVCRVRGRAGGAQVDCLGTASETTTPPAWSELDALRTVSAVFDTEHALLAVARRPRGSLGHGQELVTAHLLAAGELVAVEDARLSTVYDGGGRQQSARFELFLPGEDFPRRAAGTVRAGLSLALESLRVNVAVFAWDMEGRQGYGAYEITVRDEPEEAA